MDDSYVNFCKIEVEDKVYQFPDTFTSFSIESTVKADHREEYSQKKILRQIKLINNYSLSADSDEMFEKFVIEVFKEMYNQEKIYTMRELRDIMYTKVLDTTKKSDTENFTQNDSQMLDDIENAVSNADIIYTEFYFAQLFFGLKQFIYNLDTENSYKFTVGQYGDTSDVSELTITQSALDQFDSVEEYASMLIQGGFIPHELSTDAYIEFLVSVGNYIVDKPNAYRSFKDLYDAIETYTRSGECIDRNLKQLFDEYPRLYVTTFQSIVGQVVRDKEV